MSLPGRTSGVLLPLFSVRSSRDFGIGNFGALEGLFDWLEAARQRVLMVLPLLPTAPGDPSPYSTRSAFGLNPLFIDLEQVPDFLDAGGVAALSDDEKRKLEQARAAKRVQYGLVFPLVGSALRRAFEHFYATHWLKKSERARALERYLDEQRGWLDSFTLFSAISHSRDLQAWWEWPEPLRTRQPQALAEERERLAKDILFHGYLQWVAETQWRALHQSARQRGLLLCGDEPFIIGQDSADCWANPSLLRRDARLGVPPDEFSATGQDWGLPYFDFEAMEREDYAWLRFRAQKAASYYDLRRVDHAVGYFRQWIRDSQTPTGRFIPADEERHRVLGERHFQLLSRDAGIIAEDLGVIPPWVREILGRLQLPGYRVLRWERDGNTYRNPHHFPNSSLVTTGTHDTEPVRDWWENARDDEREAMARGFPEFSGVPVTREFTPAIHRAHLASAAFSSSDLCILPWQDVLGTLDRVNLPGSMSDANWSYRMDQTTESLRTDSQTRAASEMLALLTQQAHR